MMESVDHFRSVLRAEYAVNKYLVLGDGSHGVNEVSVFSHKVVAADDSAY